MKPFDFRKLLLWSVLALAAVGGWLRAEEPPAPAPEPAAAPTLATPPDKSSDVQATDEHPAPAKDAAEVSEPAKTDEAAPASSEPEEKPARPAKRGRRGGSRDDDRVSVGDNNHIPAGTTVPQSAVAVMGDLTVDGEVLQDAVAVMGNNTINGHVHHSAVAIMGDTGRSLADVLDDFASFYFDTALSSSAAALPSLFAFAKPGHVTFGSDWPFAPVAAGKLFAAGLETYPGLDAGARAAIERSNAVALFPRLGKASTPDAGSAIDRVRQAASRAVVRGMVRLINTG